MTGTSLFAWQFFAPVTSRSAFYLYALVATVLFFAVMAVLHRLPPTGKKWLTIISTFVAGLFYSVEFFWPVHAIPGGEGNWLTPYVEPVSDFVQYVFLWTIGLGLISLAMVHGKRLFKRLPDWHNSLAFFLSMLAIMVVGFWSEAGHGGPPAVRFTYESLFTGLLINLDAATFSLLAFYIASAAYRAFRIQTAESGFLMFAALLVMLGFVNFGVSLTNWIPAESGWAFFRIERLSSWLLMWINMPGQRAVLIGVAVGSLAMAMRIWLNLERGAFFSQEQ